MQLTDPNADRLTRIRNANNAKHDKVAIPFSKIKESIENRLRNEGYITEYESKEEGRRKDRVVTLKTVNGEQ
ncbi:30S ribosomal protein S8, partial [Streptobacillus moniliformis]|uniref:30S ribosomal protein S8 n=1 Tax=Streptobacillus moniliformis TaxID=34105 RepID=UPI000ACE80C6